MFHRLKPGRTGTERATRGATWPSAASREAKNNVASPRGEREHGKAPDSRLPLEEGCQDTVFPAPNFYGEEKNACFLLQTFAGKGKTRVSCFKLLRGREKRVFLAPKLRWEEIYARILSQIFAGKKFTRVSCPKTSLGKNLRAYLAPNPRWQEIYARILSQILAGKKFTRVSCSKSPLARNLRAYLAPNPRWQGIYARILLQIPAGKKFTRVSSPKTSLARNLRAYLVPNPRWQGIYARILLQIFAGKVSRRDSCGLAAATCASRRCRDVACRVSLKQSRRNAYRADAGIPRICVKGETRRVSTSWTRKRRNPARPRGVAARERGRRSPAPPRRYRSILPPSEVTLATISSSPARLWSPGMVFLRALAKSRHR